jgi:hypothetical protein
VPLVVGFILYMLVGLLHADGPTNNHRAVLAVYASSARRTAVHLGQFVGMAVIIAEPLALYVALDLRAVDVAWLARLVHWKGSSLTLGDVQVRASQGRRGRNTGSYAD